jgi:RNA polymerase sigma-70 factor (ECF subfamily)
MHGEHGSDEWLMREVALGRKEHLSTLLRRHADSVLTFIQRMIADRHRAEELFQDVFLAVWTHRGSYEYPRRFRPWLFGIAINKCRADFRKPVLRPLALDEETAEFAVAAGPSPAQAAVAAETAMLVAAAVARLPDAQRMVLILRIWNGLPYGEIAQTMKLAEATARSHMFHALAAVRKYLEPRMKDLT